MVNSKFEPGRTEVVEASRLSCCEVFLARPILKGCFLGRNFAIESTGQG